MSNDQAELNAFAHQGIVDWVAKNLGATVTKITRQRRWRPVWQVDAEKDGKPMPLMFKGTRPDNSIPYPLEHEYRMLRVLEDNGIPVPTLYGMCQQPHAIVMGWMEGGRDPGLVVEAIESKSEMNPERWQASLDYMEILAKIHNIDPAQFVAAGCEMPTSDHDIAMNGYERFYQMYLDAKLSDPFLEFVTQWLRRNVPKHKPKVSFVTGDCGQFLSKGSKVTVLLDMEAGYLSDHASDLACFRGRHPVENMGDVRALFDHYAKFSDQPLDLDAIRFYTVLFLALAVFTPLFFVVEPTPGGDWVEGAIQVAFISRRALEALAEIIDVELDEIELPAPRPAPMENYALDKLSFDINNLSLTDTFADWQRNSIAGVPEYLRNQFHYGAWAQEQELDELVEILGYRPVDIIEANKALTSFVKQAGPEHDKVLTKLFHRRYLRQCHVITGPNPPEDHLVLMKVEPLT
ncbi:MAG: phosphotransferase [Spongiibacteraceae bacterium]